MVNDLIFLFFGKYPKPFFRNVRSLYRPFIAQKHMIIMEKMKGDSRLFALTFHTVNIPQNKNVKKAKTRQLPEEPYGFAATGGRVLIRWSR